MRQRNHEDHNNDLEFLLTNKMTTTGHQVLAVKQDGQVIGILPGQHVHHQHLQQHLQQQQQFPQHQQMMLTMNPSPFVQYLPASMPSQGQQTDSHVQYQVLNNTMQSPQMIQSTLTVQPQQMQQLIQQQQIQLMHQQIQQQNDLNQANQVPNNINGDSMGPQLIQCAPLIQQATQVVVNPVTGQIIGHVAPSPHFQTMTITPVNQMISHQVFPGTQIISGGHHLQAGPAILPVQQISPQINLTPVQTVVHQIPLVQQQSQVQTIEQTVETQTVTQISSKSSTASEAAKRVERIIKQQQEQILQQQSLATRIDARVNNKISTRLKNQDLQTISPSIATVSSTTPMKEAKNCVPASVASDIHRPLDSDCQSLNPEADDSREQSVSSEDRLNSHSSSLEMEEENSESRTSFSSSPSSRMEPESTTQNTVASAISTNARIVDGVNLEEVKEFARIFKRKRLHLGLTQTQVGTSLSQSQGPSYSQSAICRFEKLEITPKSALKIMPVLRDWMSETEAKYESGELKVTDITGCDSVKKRRKRTTFSSEEQEILIDFFSRNQFPTPYERNELANKIRRDTEVVRVWFCNRRQALKNEIKGKLVNESQTGEDANQNDNNNQDDVMDQNEDTNNNSEEEGIDSTPDDNTA